MVERVTGFWDELGGESYSMRFARGQFIAVIRITLLPQLLTPSAGHGSCTDAEVGRVTHNGWSDLNSVFTANGALLALVGNRRVGDRCSPGYSSDVSIRAGY